MKRNCAGESMGDLEGKESVKKKNAIEEMRTKQGDERDRERQRN